MMFRSMILAALVVGSATLAAQGPHRGDARDFGQAADVWCAEAERWGRDERFACDVREESLPGVALLDIDTGGNGGIRVRGSSGSTARLRFRVVTHARSEVDAQSLAKAVEIATTGGQVRVRGPRQRDGDGWSVDIEVESPRELPLTLATNNGGISIDDMAGRTRFETTNGGVLLTGVAGDVRGRTVNGGVTVELDGRRWNGDGLDVATTNGGVRMVLPDGYNAELIAETTNGSMNIDFPVTVQGRLSGLNRRIVTRLGSGGPPLRVRTVNGGVSIAKR